VGYLSADLNRHPVGRFLLPILKGHDRNIVAVFGLSTTQEQDQTTQELQQQCDRWLDLRHRNGFDMARQIADLQLDVLVELGGFTSQSPIDVLVHRPAPIQLSYLGYCGPTYIEAIDGWIGDQELFGGLNDTDQEAHSLIHVEGGYMAYAPSQHPPLQEPELSRPFRFGSFNHSRKLTNASIDLFCSVLKACPNTELLLKSISFVEKAERERTRERFAAAGLEPHRLVIQPWVEGWENHMACYRGMDVALDPLPYGGATTTCEALSMGVPVISLAGESMASRLSSSILVSLQQPEWVARSRNEYLSIASALSATATPRPLEQRLELRQQLMRSPLGNGRRVSQELEHHYVRLSRMR
jgi:predicted O-linked N-acetylglucosamine transferase (SPINDLY family)